MEIEVKIKLDVNALLQNLKDYRDGDIDRLPYVDAYIQLIEQYVLKAVPVEPETPVKTSHLLERLTGNLVLRLQNPRSYETFIVHKGEGGKINLERRTDGTCGTNAEYDLILGNLTLQEIDWLMAWCPKIEWKFKIQTLDIYAQNDYI